MNLLVLLVLVQLYSMVYSHGRLYQPVPRIGMGTLCPPNDPDCCMLFPIHDPRGKNLPTWSDRACFDKDGNVMTNIAWSECVAFGCINIPGRSYTTRGRQSLGTKLFFDFTVSNSQRLREALNTCGGEANKDTGVNTEHKVATYNLQNRTGLQLEDPEMSYVKYASYIDIVFEVTRINNHQHEPQWGSGVRVAINYLNEDDKSFNDNVLTDVKYELADERERNGLRIRKGLFDGDMSWSNDYFSIGMEKTGRYTLTVPLPPNKTGPAVIQWAWLSHEENGLFIGCADVEIIDEEIAPGMSELRHEVVTEAGLELRCAIDEGCLKRGSLCDDLGTTEPPYNRWRCSVPRPDYFIDVKGKIEPCAQLLFAASTKCTGLYPRDITEVTCIEGYFSNRGDIALLEQRRQNARELAKAKYLPFTNGIVENCQCAKEWTLQWGSAEEGSLIEVTSDNYCKLLPTKDGYGSGELVCKCDPNRLEKDLMDASGPSQNWGVCSKSITSGINTREWLLPDHLTITTNTGEAKNFVDTLTYKPICVGSGSCDMTTYNGKNGVGMSFKLTFQSVGAEAMRKEGILSAVIVDFGTGYVEGETITINQDQMRRILVSKSFFYDEIIPGNGTPVEMTTQVVFTITASAARGQTSTETLWRDKPIIQNFLSSASCSTCTGWDPSKQGVSKPAFLRTTTAAPGFAKYEAGRTGGRGDADENPKKRGCWTLAEYKELDKYSDLGLCCGGYISINNMYRDNECYSPTDTGTFQCFASIDKEWEGTSKEFGDLLTKYDIRPNKRLKWSPFNISFNDCGTEDPPLRCSVCGNGGTKYKCPIGTYKNGKSCDGGVEDTQTCAKCENNIAGANCTSCEPKTGGGSSCTAFICIDGFTDDNGIFGDGCEVSSLRNDSSDDNTSDNSFPWSLVLIIVGCILAIGTTILVWYLWSQKSKDPSVKTKQGEDRMEHMEQNVGIAADSVNSESQGVPRKSRVPRQSVGVAVAKSQGDPTQAREPRQSVGVAVAKGDTLENASSEKDRRVTSGYV